VTNTDPVAIENYNLHGFDLPFLARRAQILGVPLALGRIGPQGRRVRAARRGRMEDPEGRRVRYVAPGRELIDTMGAVLRYEFRDSRTAKPWPQGRGKHLGIAGQDRELIRGDQVYSVYWRDPGTESFPRLRRWDTRCPSRRVVPSNTAEISFLPSSAETR